jgi:hypothetical protein
MQKHAPHHVGSRCVGHKLYLFGWATYARRLRSNLHHRASLKYPEFCLTFDRDLWDIKWPKPGKIYNLRMSAQMEWDRCRKGPLTLSRKSSPHCGSTSPAKLEVTCWYEDSEIIYSV